MIQAAVFPGQGSQRVGMGLESLEGTSEVEKLLEVADELCECPLSDLMMNGPKEELDQTIHAQPAIFVANHILWSLIGRENVKPSYFAGHSLGELSACEAAGVFSFETGLAIVSRRATLMAEAAASKKGGMMAIIGLEDREVVEISANANLEAVNFNCPGQVVVAGDEEALRKSEDIFKKSGAKKVLKLAVGGAFHSKAMTGAAEGFSEFLEGIEFHRPKAPIVSSEIAEVVEEPKDIRRALSRQLVNPVRWRQTIDYMIKMGVEEFVEIGPGKVISGLIKRISREAIISHVAKYSSKNS